MLMHLFMCMANQVQLLNTTLKAPFFVDQGASMTPTEVIHTNITPEYTFAGTKHLLCVHV